MRIALRVATAATLAASLWAGDWSAPSEAVSRDGTVLVSCRAKVAGDYLLVEVQPVGGWHVYAMDNELRAKEALAGKMSLGVEQNTEVHLDDGLERIGNWYQTEPSDFSQPELRWYSYGYAEPALLAAEVKRGSAPQAKVTVRAQACDSASCVTVEAVMDVPIGDTGDSTVDLDGLVPVRGM